MMRLNFIHSALSTLLVISLLGCSEQPVPSSPQNKASDYLLPALIKGQYHNATNSDVFELGEQASFFTSHGNFTKPYFVQNQHVIIVMKKKPKEQRPNLSLAITDNGNKLTCLSCPKFGLPNQWFKR
ncbi:hypothetical protein MACH09_46820 [Vibrio sp. MACH09]|uniref:hypothetical protein n=1 Tax=Vibrio sp. MACH09 TaxID=3025122 RepID=UPI002793608F|nr:hypothetical protein [Vibrio sp. MACH09]GLO64174.1 hypothetical protein MACH09_46820 [Vibrio sp. MACH09]